MKVKRDYHNFFAGTRLYMLSTCTGSKKIHEKLAFIVGLNYLWLCSRTFHKYYRHIRAKNSRLHYRIKITRIPEIFLFLRFLKNCLQGSVILAIWYIY